MYCLLNTVGANIPMKPIFPLDEKVTLKGVLAGILSNSSVIPNLTSKVLDAPLFYTISIQSVLIFL